MKVLNKLKSLRRGAGYLQIDHTNSPGISADDVARLPFPGAVVAPGGTVTERDIKQCSHCQRGIVLEPLRTRERGYCPRCNHYVCDQCEAIRVKTGECVPFPAVLDKVHTHIERFQGREDHPDAARPLVTLT